jgi:hypothetical protein
MKWYNVIVEWPDGDSISDAIKGTSEENAMENARWNWPDACNIVVGEAINE